LKHILILCELTRWESNLEGICKERSVVVGDNDWKLVPLIEGKHPCIETGRQRWDISHQKCRMLPD
jgi:hypothetical protein